MTRPIEPDADGHKVRVMRNHHPHIALYQLEADVDDIIRMLQDIREEIGEDFELSNSTDDDDNIVFEVYTYRYETDTERDARLVKEEKHRQQAKEWEEHAARREVERAVWLEKTERAQLASLLKKYGPKEGDK